MDRQNRVGSKPGGGGIASTQAQNRARKQRLAELAMESFDLSKDPYFMQNSIGRYECRLCLTQHKTESNYLAHTQGSRHQQNLRRRQIQNAERENNSEANLAAQQAKAEADRMCGEGGCDNCPDGAPFVCNLESTDECANNSVCIETNGANRCAISSDNQKCPDGWFGPRCDLTLGCSMHNAGAGATGL